MQNKDRPIPEKRISIRRHCARIFTLAHEFTTKLDNPYLLKNLIQTGEKPKCLLSLVQLIFLTKGEMSAL